MTTSRSSSFSPSLPAVFTEHGAIMAATVLTTERAIKVSVYVVRAFVKLREMLGTQKEFTHKLEDLEKRLVEHDEKFSVVFEAIRELMQPAAVPPRSAASVFPLARSNDHERYRRE